MSKNSLFDVDVLQLPGRYWLTIAEKEDADKIIDLLAEASNRIEPGRLGILEAKPVLINNLRAWENLILPRWYHHAGSLQEHEQQLSELLHDMEVDVEKILLMMSKLPGQLDLAQRRVVALLRVVLQHAPVWVVEEEWLEWWSDTKGRNPLLLRMYQHIVLPETIIIISTRLLPQEYLAIEYQSINLSVDALV